MTTLPPVDLVDTEKVLLSLSPHDADGQPVTDGPFTWTADNSSNPVDPDTGLPTVAIALEPAADGLTCWALTPKLGSANVVVTDGTLTSTVVLNVKAGPASDLGLSVGTPVPEKP